MGRDGLVYQHRVLDAHLVVRQEFQHLQLLLSLSSGPKALISLMCMSEKGQVVTLGTNFTCHDIIMEILTVDSHLPHDDFSFDIG
jgi:hypothetical protein